MKVPFLLGRLIVGGFFLYNGIHHFKQRQTTVKYVSEKTVLASELAVIGTGVALVLGGASVLLGLNPKSARRSLRDFLPRSRRSCTISGAREIPNSA
jgi:putative oxidoreductase